MYFKKGAEPWQAILIITLGIVSFAIILFGVVSLICGTIISFSGLSGQDALCKIPHFGVAFKDDKVVGDVFNLTLNEYIIITDPTKKLIVDFTLENIFQQKGLVGAGLCTTNLKCLANEIVVEPFNSPEFLETFSGSFSCVIEPLIQNNSDSIFNSGLRSDVSWGVLIYARGVKKCPYGTDSKDPTINIYEITDGEGNKFLLSPKNYEIGDFTINPGFLRVKAIQNYKSSKTNLIVKGRTVNPTLSKALTLAEIDISDGTWGCSSDICSKEFTFESPSAGLCTDTVSIDVGKISGELNYQDNTIELYEQTSTTVSYYQLYNFISEELSSRQVSDSIFQMFTVLEDIIISGFVYHGNRELGFKVYTYDSFDGLVDLSTPDYTINTIGSLGEGGIARYVKFNDNVLVGKNKLLIMGVNHGGDYHLKPGFINNEKIRFYGTNKSTQLTFEFDGIDNRVDEEFYIYPVIVDDGFTIDLTMSTKFSYNKIEEMVLTVDNAPQDSLNVSVVSQDYNHVFSKSGSGEIDYPLSLVNVRDLTLGSGKVIDVSIKFDISKLFIKMYYAKKSSFLEDVGSFSGVGFTSLFPKIEIKATHNNSFGCYAFRIKDETGELVSILAELDKLETKNMWVFDIVPSGQEATLKANVDYDSDNTVYISEIYDVPEDCGNIYFSHEYSRMFGGSPSPTDFFCGDPTRNKVIFNKTIINLNEQNKREIVALLLWATGKVI